MRSMLYQLFHNCLSLRFVMYKGYNHYYVSMHQCFQAKILFVYILRTQYLHVSKELGILEKKGPSELVSNGYIAKRLNIVLAADGPSHFSLSNSHPMLAVSESMLLK